MGVAPHNLNEAPIADPLESLLALEQNTAKAINKERSHQRLEGAFKVAIKPGNASQHELKPLPGVCQDVSQSGCRIATQRPVMVGDVYQLRFDPASLKLPAIFARCIRCRLLREEMFENGFAFFSHVDLPSADGTKSSLL